MLRHPSARRLYELAGAGAEPSAQVRRHLETCTRCRGEIASIQQLLDFSRSAAVIPEPRDDGFTEGFETRLWARLQSSDNASPRRRVAPALGWGLAAAALLAAGLLWTRVRTASVPAPPAPASVTVRTRVVRAAAANQFDRAEMLLVTLAHAPTSQNATVVDLSLEQGWARELVDTNRLVKQSAAWNGQSQLAQLLSDLDPVLLQIAHAPATVSHAQWQLLQDRITASGLLFRMRIAGQNLARTDSSVEDGTL
ncbi:MAG: hypothetical protein ACRD2D_09875 [Terriglobales bacterium]